MTFSTEWADLLTWTVQVVSPSGKDSYGNEVWTAPVEVRAHVDTRALGERQSDRPDREAQTTRSGTIYFGTDAGVTPVPRTRFTLPFGQVVDATRVVEHYDDAGVSHHYEVEWEAST